MERTNLTKYMADINASLANVQSTLDDLKTQVSEGFANQDELRRDDLRKVTARVAAIGNQVSYLRETVCNSLTNSRAETEIALEDRYRKTREALRKATKTEISVMRDLFLKAHPSLFEAEDGRLVVAAVPPAGAAQHATDGDEEPKGVEAVAGPSHQQMGEEKMDVKLSAPPKWAMQAMPTDNKAMTLDEMKSAFNEKMPFEDDIDIWELLGVPGAQAALIEFLDANLPDGVTKTTDNPKYGDHIIFSLLSDSYTEDHVIPTTAEEPGEYSPHVLPPVPKQILALLHALAEKNKSDVFDIDTFWKHIRQHFPEMCTTDTAGKKPTATSLLQQGQAAVSEEEQAAKASTRVGYEKLLHLMREYRSSSDDSPSPPAPGEHNVTKAPGDVTLDLAGLGAGLDTTIGEQIRLEMRSQKYVTDETKSDEKSRKRTTKEDKAAVVDIKKAKKGDKE